jgi:hypothetical protein
MQKADTQMVGMGASEYQPYNYNINRMFRNCYRKFTQLLHKKYLTKLFSVYNIFIYIRDIKILRYIFYII